MIRKLWFLPLIVYPVSANTTYYWVPSNIQLFHIDFPYDFILYFFAVFGFVAFSTLAYWYIEDLIKRRRKK
jgi:hypothetical protein